VSEPIGVSLSARRSYLDLLAAEVLAVQLDHVERVQEYVPVILPLAAPTQVIVGTAECRRSRVL
jgi:hypothetical protein